MKALSDKCKQFSFEYTFKDFDTAQVGAHALMGYMTGTYYQPVIDVTYVDNRNKIKVVYISDSSLNHIFARICRCFKDYYKHSEEEA